MQNQLEALKLYTTVVADTGDFLQLAQYLPQDATTNPSLILKSVQKPDYLPLLKDTVSRFRQSPTEEIVDRLLVRFGCEILTKVPGRVSTEVDARLSFDTQSTIKRALRLIDMYRSEGIEPQRILIKIAATWEGIQAAELLEQLGIHTNLTLLFSLCQAVSCGKAKVKLISPFVGRIYDWHKMSAGAKWNETLNSGINDPGVRSVREIFNYYKHFDIATEVMGASFRNLEQIRALVGCDLLTISPNLLTELSASSAPLSLQLDATTSKEMKLQELDFNESAFRFALNQDAMSTEKLSEGIRTFCADALILDQLIQAN